MTIAPSAMAAAPSSAAPATTRSAMTGHSADTGNFADQLQGAAAAKPVVGGPAPQGARAPRRSAEDAKQKKNDDRKTAPAPDPTIAAAGLQPLPPMTMPELLLAAFGLAPGSPAAQNPGGASAPVVATAPAPVLPVTSRTPAPPPEAPALPKSAGPAAPAAPKYKAPVPAVQFSGAAAAPLSEALAVLMSGIPASPLPEAAAAPATGGATATLPVVPHLPPPDPSVSGENISANPSGSAKSSSTATGAAASAPGATDVAFAAKVQPAPAAARTESNGPRPAPEEITPHGASNIRKATVETEIKEIAPTPDPVPFAGSVAAAFQRVASDTAPALDTSAPNPPAPPQEVRTTQREAVPPSSAPLKEISVQLSEPQQPRVDVRMVAESGQLRVVVRSGDGDLAHGLRQELPQLVGKLEENGFRTETWRPAEASASLTAAAEMKNTAGQSRNFHSQSDSGGSQQWGGQRQQDQSRRPRWVEELESSLSGGKV